MTLLTPTDSRYYIKPRAVSFAENDLGDVNRVYVSIASGTTIMVYVPEDNLIPYDDDKEYQKWVLTGYPTKLATSDAYYIYARLSRSDNRAIILFSTKKYKVDGSVEGEEGGGNASGNYYYIPVGNVTATDGATLRTLSFDSGKLSTPDNSYTKEQADAQFMSFEVADKRYLNALDYDEASGLIRFLKGLSLGESGNPISSVITAENAEDSTLYTENALLSAAAFSKLFSIAKDDKGNSYIRTPYPLASDSTVSSLGVGEDEGGIGGAAALYQLVDVLADGDKVSGAEDGNVLMYDAATGKWYGKKVDIPKVDFSEVNEKIAALETRDTEHSNAIDALQAADVQHGKDIAANATSISTLQTDLKSTSDALSDLQGEHNALAGTVNDFLTGVDVDDTINRWKELEKFLTGYTETATLADLLGVKADKSVVDALTVTVNSNYTTLDGLITAEKNRAVAAEGALSGRITTNATNIETNRGNIAKNTKDIADIFTTLADWFTLEDGVLHSKYGLASDKTVSSLGLGTDGTDGVSYDRLDSWNSYTDDKAGYILSAALGWDLKTRLDNLDIGDFDLSGYLSKSEASSTYATISSLSGYLTKSEASGTYATISSLSGYLTKSEASGTYATISSLSGYQPLITDLATIRDGAALGATALQSSDLDGVTSAIQTQLNALSSRIKAYEDILKIEENNTLLHATVAFASDSTVSSLGVGSDGEMSGGVIDLTNVVSHIIPSLSNAYTIGDANTLWKAVYATELYAGNVAVGSAIASLQSTLGTATSNIQGLTSALSSVISRVGNIENTYVTSSALGDFAYKNSLAWSELTDKPTVMIAHGWTDADWNTVKTNGTYYVGGTSTNRPASYGQMIVSRNGDTTAQLYIGFSSGVYKMFFRGWSDTATVPGWTTLLDSSNYTDYTYSKSTVDTKLGAYLPLSGGTITSEGVGLTINRTHATNPALIRFSDNGNTLGYLGVDKQKHPVFNDGSEIAQLIHSGNIGSQSVSYATSAGNADNATKWGGFKYYNVVTDSINNAPYFKLITIRIISAYVNNAISFDVSGRSKGVAHIEVYPSGKASIGEAGVLRVEVTGNSLFADKIGAYTIGNETDSSGNIIAKVIEVWYTKSQQSYDSVVVQNVHWGQSESVEINCSKYAALPTSYESYVDATMGSIYGSITKLTTPRTLWGKSFDGSANISGNLTGVGSITGGGLLSLVSTNSDIYLKRNDDNTTSLLLNASAFRPFETANGLLNLGTASARWKGIYGQTLDLTENIKLSNNKYIYWRNTDGAETVFLHLNTSNDFHLGNSGYGSYLTGKVVGLRYGASRIVGLVLTEDGNVGINISSPTYRLDVYGTFRASGNATIGGTLNVTDAATFDSTLKVTGAIESNALRRWDGTTANETPFVHGESNNTDITLLRASHAAAKSYKTSGAYGFSLKYIGTGGGNANYLKLLADNQTATSQVLAICVDQSGNVGIGTENDSSYKLEVGGTLGVTGATTLSDKLTISKNGMSVAGTAYFGGGTTYYFGSSGNIYANTLSAAATTLRSTLSVTGVATFNNNIKAKKYIYFGANDEAWIYWDDDNKVLRTNASFASDGTMSSLGVGSDEGGGGSVDWSAVPTNILPALNNEYNLGSASLRWGRLYINGVDSAGNISSTANITAQGNLVAVNGGVSGNTLSISGSASVGSLTVGGNAINFGNYALKTDIPSLSGYVTIAGQQTITGLKYFSQVPAIDLGTSKLLLATMNDVPSITPLQDSGTEIARIDLGGEQVFLYTPNANIPSLEGYATQSWVNTQLGSYYTIADIDTMLSGYALKTWINTEYVSKSSASTITAKLTVNEFSSNGSISTGGNLSVYGNITIAMGGLTAANGTVSAKTITQTSDERLKSLIGDVRLSLGAMACAPLKKFHYHDDGLLRVGTIAQYWQGALPEVVSTTPNGTLALAYGELGVAMGISLANHLTDLKADLSVTDNEVEKLKKRVEELENENKRLQERVDALAA